jgi:hypothetical protein
MSRRQAFVAGVAAGAAIVWVWVIWRSAVASPRTIGPVVVVGEETTQATWIARVDTGASVSSLHCPEGAIVGELDINPRRNIGRSVTLRTPQSDGSEVVIEARIADYSEIRTEEVSEYRYQVWLRLRCDGVVKETLVSLNDRSAMRYKFLLGRDFLRDAFVVDVSIGENAYP